MNDSQRSSNALSVRLEEIKARAKTETDVVWDTQACANDRDWLIAEVERLRATHEPAAVATDYEVAFLDWEMREGHACKQVDAFAAGARWAHRAAPPPCAWQPIETAPRNGDRILLAANVHSPAGPRLQTGYYSIDPYVHISGEVIGAEEGFQCDGDQCIPTNQDCFTHWAPIPALTKAAEL